MFLYNSIDEFKTLKNAVVTIGTFDGVHIGHQKIINRVNEIAKATGGESVVLTFFPHPRMVLHPDDHGLVLLNTLEEKKQLMKQYGVQHLIVHPFSQKFSRTSVTEYVRDMLVNKIGTKKLVIGYDHHFGRNREGTLKDLQELGSVYNFEVEEIPEQDIHDVAVSSTKIRKSLLEGDVAAAKEFLGHDYSLCGIVVKGKELGRTLGFPTANIHVPENYKLIPAKGIYAVTVEIQNAEKHEIGMMSIGTRPTFDDGDLSIEVNILNFEKNIYGERITVFFKSRLRDELKFDSAEELVKQMEQDKLDTLKIFS
ncbi:MAG TPA: bifunctional riboflavin kinase/FAD synthetase [Bacteroidia bacterium]|nr:bifunctional riboflavin kinase/FAD synthetase [Bacteroidia bacterium]